MRALRTLGVFLAGFAVGGLLVWRFEIGRRGPGDEPAATVPVEVGGEVLGGDPSGAVFPGVGDEAGRGAVEEPARSGRIEPVPAPGADLPPPPSAVAEDVVGLGDPVRLLRSRRLTMPVRGASRAELVDDFADSRGGGTRRHEGLDILAPRGTPVLAVEDGKIEKLFLSQPGGITIYQYDPSQTYCYYYAHLQRYAPHLAEGQQVRRGEVIGYVGTTGNAPPDTPHLHFAIYRLAADKHWWEGTPLNPFQVLHP